MKKRKGHIPKPEVLARNKKHLDNQLAAAMLLKREALALLQSAEVEINQTLRSIAKLQKVTP